MIEVIFIAVILWIFLTNVVIKTKMILFNVGIDTSGLMTRGLIQFDDSI